MRWTLVLATILGAVCAGVAAADGGGPSPGVTWGSPGAVDAKGAVRYVALDAGPGRTTVAAIGVRGGRVLRWGFVKGTFGIPQVAYDGSTSGLARNGRRLVLGTFATYGATDTRFVILHPRTLRVRSRLTLRGAFAFDAISPGGSLMYLLQYLGNRNDGRYAVRVLNLNTHELYPGALVDRREPDEKMTGIAITRADSRDGAWAYTLYSRQSKHPFVHALDTVHRRAFCVDLPWNSTAAWVGSARMRIGADGKTLEMRYRGRVRARMDTKTFEVSRG
jgi:hypothetical protein